MIGARIPLVLAAGLVLLACSDPPTTDDAGSDTMTQEAERTLKTSDDPKKLLAAALLLARGKDPGGHRALRGALRDAGFHDRLAKPEEERFPAKDQKVRRVLESLAANDAAEAKPTLLALLDDPAFNAVGARTECLILCTAGFRPPPASLLAFWGKHFLPDDGYTALTLRTLFENGTKEALSLFRERLLDPSHELDDRKTWLHFHVFPRRNDPEVLRCADAVLTKNAPAEIRSELIDVLFDDKSAVWFTPARNENPPPLTAYSPSAAALVRTLGARARSEGFATDEQKAAIAAFLEKLDAVQ